ncbi:exodeoxyribonuclease VII large subunit [Pseudogemmobacter faecipullorum]|uniref:Exodeoxyribonuclease 7 large subunit n=1 Tax=Pseudogemmobacter faecipullorum TaxID=2755041 RepID=A0ABS8CMC8_9RHOB|nr:exodeoxyribonuclease VII large subunit [Pseudogemmobacter faecipullorum]MCB5410551.1 exodeoxyribonuclease VII large subunit [Pseudogemmobacter faecipullorum]
MDLFEDSPAPTTGNSPEFTVSELSGAVKRVIEGEFGLVRVRGEIGRVSRPASGHLYYDLKDDRSVIAAITWKGQAARLSVRPEEGMEVVATGRMTTFPGQSKYQLIIDDIAPAGAGALMAMLERRRAALQAEGLFDPARKQPIPWLPKVIGVITSPSGAVIRDILHRLRDRFPRPVLIWPVPVQGERCAPEVAAAIRGFNALPQDGPIPRPDLLIVARGGGSLEDLWGFNEEIVVRAAAESRIPLISAVGHETDTTLLDFAADLRAPTPTAAAELAVPVRLELLAGLEGLSGRLLHAVVQRGQRQRQRLSDLSRALPRPETLTGQAAQRLDHAAGRLGGGLGLMAARKRSEFERVAGQMRAGLLLSLVSRRGDALEKREEAMAMRFERRLERARDGFQAWSSRLAPALGRVIAQSSRQAGLDRLRLQTAAARLDQALLAQHQRLTAWISGFERVLETLNYQKTLERGFAVVRARGEGGGEVITSLAGAAGAGLMEIQFADGRVEVQPAGSPPAAAPTGAAPRAAAPGAAAAAAKAAPAAKPTARKGGSADEGGQGSLF